MDEPPWMRSLALYLNGVICGALVTCSAYLFALVFCEPTVRPVPRVMFGCISLALSLHWSKSPPSRL